MRGKGKTKGQNKSARTKRWILPLLPLCLLETLPWAPVLSLRPYKAYVEAKDSNGRPDDVVADEAWEGHLKRNQSIVVDLFQGQLKSALQCPVCDNLSVTFDPFMYLSVPLQLASDQTKCIDVFWIPAQDPTKNTTKCRVKVPVNSTLSTLITNIGTLHDVDPASIMLGDVLAFNGKVWKFLADTERISDLFSADVYAYEVPELRGAATPEVRKEKFVRLSVQIKANHRSDRGPTEDTPTVYRSK